MKQSLFFLLTMITSLNSSAMENDNSAAKSTKHKVRFMETLCDARSTKHNVRFMEALCEVCEKHVTKKTRGFCGEEEFDFNFFAQHALLLERFHKLHEDYIDEDEKISLIISSKKTLELITHYKKIIESKDDWKKKYTPLIEAMKDVLNCTTTGLSLKEMEGVREGQCSKLTKEYFSNDGKCSYDYHEYDYDKVITAFCLISSWKPTLVDILKTEINSGPQATYTHLEVLTELPKEIACLENKLEGMAQHTLKMNQKS